MPTESTPTLTFRVTGLCCAEEATALRQELGPLIGGADRLAFDFVNGRMIVTPTDSRAKADAIVAAVARTGMTAEPWHRESTGHRERDARARVRTRLTVAAGLAAAAGFVVHGLAAGWLEALGAAPDGPAPALARVLYGAAVAAGFWLVAPRAWGALRRRRPDMNLLMTIAVTGALVIGEWFEAAVVSFLFALSLELESWSLSRARRAVDRLLDLSPPMARRRGAGGIEEIIPPESLLPGDVVTVRPGERIPIDGVVESGRSDVNEAPITGESRAGRPPAGGRDLRRHHQRARGAGGRPAPAPCTRRPSHHIVRMVEAAQARRAPTERWVDRFARVYTPAVMGLALLVAVVPPLLFGAAWGTWFYRALVLLVIGCPCALVISTPVSVVAALAAAARHGVLIKGGRGAGKAGPHQGLRLRQDRHPDRGTPGDGRRSCRWTATPRRSCWPARRRWSPPAITRWPGPSWSTPASGGS